MKKLYRITFTRSNGNKCVTWVKGMRREATTIANGTFLHKGDEESIESISVAPEREYTLEEVKALGATPTGLGGDHKYIEFSNDKS